MPPSQLILTGQKNNTNYLRKLEKIHVRVISYYTTTSLRNVVIPHQLRALKTLLTIQINFLEKCPNIALELEVKVPFVFDDCKIMNLYL